MMTDAELCLNLHTLHQNCQTLMLGTLNAEAAPAVSYAPYVWHQGRYYVFVSALAQHTAYLQNHSRVGLMLIEDEFAARNLFARRRLMIDAVACPVGRDTALGEAVLAKMRDHFGAAAALTQSLGDFVLIGFVPNSMRLVLGFGQAHDIGSSLLSEALQAA